MKPTELRIGNLVKARNEIVEICTLTSLTDMKPSCQAWIKVYGEESKVRTNECFWLDALTPIPLTEEWLEKFGFEKDENLFSKNILDVYRNRDGVDGRQRFVLISNEYTPELVYVHQLQNLYFALTGEELKCSSGK